LAGLVYTWACIVTASLQIILASRSDKAALDKRLPFLQWFINSDFYTPLMYLVERFWPMAVGVLIANWEDFFQKNPWKRVLLPL
jgi:hypothetical protein